MLIEIFNNFLNIISSYNLVLLLCLNSCITIPSLSVYSSYIDIVLKITGVETGGSGRYCKHLSDETVSKLSSAPSNYRQKSPHARTRYFPDQSGAPSSNDTDMRCVHTHSDGPLH